MLLLVWDVIRLAALWGVRRRDEWHFRLMLFPALRVLINLYVVLLRRISFQSKRRLLRLVKWGVILPGQSVCVWWLGSVRSVKMDRKISGGLCTVFPRIIAPFDGNVLNNRLNPPPPPPPPAPLAIFSSFYPLLVKLRCNVIPAAKLISDDSDPRFKLWKLIKGLKLEHLKSPCLFYLMWLVFDLMGK